MISSLRRKIITANTTVTSSVAVVTTPKQYWLHNTLSRSFPLLLNNSKYYIADTSSSTPMITTMRSYHSVSLQMVQQQQQQFPFYNNNNNKQCQLFSLCVKNTTPTLIQYRYKHGAKKGNHIKNLQDMAHTQQQEIAEERRKKKKEKKMAKKKHTTSANTENDNNEDEEEILELPDPNIVKDEMEYHIKQFIDYLKSIRGAQPTVDMFDDIIVIDAYGKNTGNTSLSSVAQVIIQTPTLAVANCYDPTTTKAVVNSIQNQLQDLNPTIHDSDTGTIHIPLPRIDQETRKQTVHNMHKRIEDYRQRIRNTRRKYMDIIKKDGMGGKIEGVSKDDAYRLQQELENITEQYIQQINTLGEKKEKDILAV